MIEKELKSRILNECDGDKKRSMILAGRMKYNIPVGYMADVYIGKERNVALKPDRDLIIKERINAQDETKDEQKARRMSVKFDNLRKELNFPTNIRANQIVESGKVDFVRNYCRKLDIAPEEFFKDSILKKSLYRQYSIKEMNTNTFLLKNKEYLEI